MNLPEFTLNPLALIALLISLSGYVIAIVFFIYAKSSIHKSWSFFNFAVATWCLFTFLGASVSDKNWAYEFWIASHVAAIFIGITYAHFVYRFGDYKIRGMVPFSYIYACLFALLIISTNGTAIYSGTVFLFDSVHYVQIHSIQWIATWSTWFGLMGWAHIHLYRHYKQTGSPKSREAIYILIIMLLGFSGGLSTVLPMAGYHHFYPYTLAMTLIYEIGASATIFRREILELDFALKKSVLYSVLISILTLIYLLLVFTADQFLQKTWGFYNFSIRIIALVILAIIFNPLRNIIQTLIDQTLFKGTPAQLAEQNELLRQNAVQAEKMRVVATLASSIAHEIKNPLTALKTFVEYFPEKKNDPAFLEKFQKIASSEISRIEQIVSELLEFAKPSPLTLQSTDIRKVLEHALNLTNNQLQKNKVIVKTDFNSNLPLIKADSNKLLQVFINLILNANDAMLNGGTLTVNTSTQTPDPRTLGISFSDTGAGIPKENLKQIFEPFFSTKEKGTGLGLAIVKGIIEDHGGKILVASNVNQGTEFIIKLPLPERHL